MTNQGKDQLSNHTILDVRSEGAQAGDGRSHVSRERASLTTAKLKRNVVAPEHSSTIYDACPLSRASHLRQIGRWER